MTTSANKDKAGALAKALAEATNTEVNSPEHNLVEEIASVLEATSSDVDPVEDQTLAEVLLDDEEEEEVKIHVPVLMKVYDVVDKITGHSPKTEDQNVSILEGRVSSADLVAAGVDIKWLLKTGALVEAGLAYV